jgi:Zn-dependent M28 family amino/carboxypeptidase
MFGTTPPPFEHVPSLERARSCVQAVSVERMRADIQNLTGPHNRLHSPEAMATAEAHIITALREAGWTVSAQQFTVTNAAGNLDLGTFTQGNFGPTIYAELHGQNIIAIKEGKSPEAIVVAAHHDTIRDSPGANDNTAAVAALLELARLTTAVDYEITVMLVAFDMEEIGFHGSRAFVREQLDGRPLRGAIVFDSIAYTSAEPNSQLLPPGFGLLYPKQASRVNRRRRVGDWAAVLYRGHSARLAATFAACLEVAKGPDSSVLLRDPADLPVAGALLHRFVPFARSFGRSDHLAFWERGLPAVMVTDTANFRSPHHHQPTDTMDILDFEHLRCVVAATSLTLDWIAQRRSPA